MKNKLFISSLFLIFNLSCMNNVDDCKKCQLKDIDHNKIVGILSYVDDSTKLALLCHKLTKEEVLLKEKKADFFSEIKRGRQYGSLPFLCKTYGNFFDKKIICNDPTPREIVKYKVEKGCKTEGCLYLYNKIKAEEKREETEQKLADKISRQKYQEMIDEYKRK